MSGRDGKGGSKRKAKRKQRQREKRKLGRSAKPVDYCPFEEKFDEAVGLPCLAVDTKVLVKEFEDRDWVERCFMKWNRYGTMVCFADGHTSKTGAGEKGADWSFWKVADGEHKGETNSNNKENSNE